MIRTKGESETSKAVPGTAHREGELSTSGQLPYVRASIPAKSLFPAGAGVRPGDGRGKARAEKKI
jgi:hypothetical protein